MSPIKVASLNTTSNTIEVNWETPFGDITGYEVAWTNISSGTTELDVTSTPPYMINNLSIATLYEVCVKSLCTNNEVSPSSCIQVLTPLSKTSFELETTAKNNIQVYPNPNNGQFSIMVDELDGQEIDIKMIDLNGKVVYQQTHVSNINTREINIDVTELPTGIYLIEYRNGNIKWHSKVVVEGR